MIRIDTHHHLWELARRPQAWLDGHGMVPIRRDFTLTDLAAPAKAVGIDRTVLVQVHRAQPARLRLVFAEMITPACSWTGSWTGSPVKRVQ